MILFGCFLLVAFFMAMIASSLIGSRFLFRLFEFIFVITFVITLIIVFSK